MEPAYNANKRKKKLFFLFILAAMAGIVSILFFTISQNTHLPDFKNLSAIAPSKAIHAKYNVVIANKQILTESIDALQTLDLQYATLLTEPGSKKQRDSIEFSINLKEDLFRAAVDSIAEKEPKYSDDNLNEAINTLLVSYKAILETRDVVRRFRNALNLDQNGIAPSQMEVLKNKNLLQEKTNKIASLESALRMLSASQASINTLQPKANDEGKLQDLEALIARQESKMNALNTVNNGLKAENDRLQKLESTAAKNSNSADLPFKAKATALEQRVDVLSAELRLAQVDCNISRVDASRAIYNAKQRKQLLSEASGILNALSQSNDPEINRKVQTKIALLKQVASISKE